MPRTNEPIDVFQFIVMRGKDDCWAWIGSWGGRSRDRRPYFMADGRRTMAYRWVWELVNGTPIPEGQMVLHSCDNGAYPIGCCNPHHMRLGSVQENSDDMTSRQRHGLPHHVVRAIRKLLDEGRTQQEVANLYGVSRELVSAIATQRVYKNVSPDGSAAKPPSEHSKLDTAKLDTTQHSKLDAVDASDDTSATADSHKLHNT